MEQENNKNKGDNVAEGLAQSQVSEKKRKKLSLAKSEIARSMAKNFLKTRKATDTSEVRKRKQKKKNKSVSEGSKATGNDAKKQNSREESPQKDATTSMVHLENGQNSREEGLQKDATTSMVHVENSQQIQKNKSGSKEKNSKSNGNPKKRRRGEGAGFFNRNRRNEEKQRGMKRRKRNEQVEKHRSSYQNYKNKEKSDGKVKKQENKMKDKIDGLIFLCNAKTKPDCFRYRVMGVSNGKKDFVLGIRRGLKLFLYDYDLKLMYGIYRASSSRGMNLEPDAFDGAFPAQVRFSVHADCFPLAESIFKKAIKENYNKNNKFKTELTARQVRELTKLFRPVGVHSTALPVHSPPSRVSVRIFEHPENREARDRPREARPPSDGEASGRDPYAHISAISYPVLSHERDRQIAYGELASTRREDIHHDLYLNGNDYGAYGFQRERRNSSFQPHMAPRLGSYHRERLGSYHRDYIEQPLRQPDMVFRESMPMQRDMIPSDPLYLTKREYRTYDLGATQEMQSTVSAAAANASVAAASTLDSYATNPYYSRYYGASSDSYLSSSGGEARRIETDHLRRENNQVDREYARYAADALADYNKRYRHQDVNPVAASSSVSHRYSFTGGFFSYR